MAQEADEATAAAVVTLGERMRVVLESMLPAEEAARASTDQCLSRWVRANDCDVDAASKGMMNYANWYIKKPQYGEDEGMQAVAQGKGAELVPNEIAAKKAFVIPDVKDADGRPIIMIHVRKHDPNEETYDIERLTLFAVHLIESAVASMVAPVDTLCCVFDLGDIGMVNVDMKAVKRILYLLTNMYPERLGRCYLLDAPVLFSASWAIISPMLKENTVRKIQFVDREGLSEVFGEDSELMKIVKEADADKTGDGYSGEMPAEAAEKAAEAPKPGDDGKPYEV